MFDTCLLLSNSGRVVYDGPQQLVLAYMQRLSFACPPNENVADFLLDVTAGEMPATHAIEIPSLLFAGCPLLENVTGTATW
jgi:hypothetical protein